MKILLALPHDTLSGAEQYLKMVAKYYLKDACCQVYVVFLKRKTAGGWEDLRSCSNIKLIYTANASEIMGLPFFMKNIFELRNHQFEYVYTSHVSLTGIMGLFIRLNVLHKRAFIGRESTTIFKRFKGIKLFSYRLQYFAGYPSLDLLICQTEAMKYQLVEALPGLAKKIKIAVVPNPVDLNAMEASSLQSSHSECLEKYGRFIVSAGRLIPEKGFDLLMMAFAKLWKQDPTLKLIILGEGRERKSLEILIKDLGMAHAIFMPGFVDNVYSYFSASVLSVVSSRIEGFPNVLLQMMSQHHKVVSTACAGGIENIEGLFVAEPNSISSLFQKMEEALSTPTAHNIPIFQAYLHRRSIDHFVAHIDSVL